MTIPTNAIYQADCLALLERMDAERTKLVYIDMPPYVPPRLRSNVKGNRVYQVEAAYQKGLYAYLLFVSKMFQQARRVLAPNGSLFIQAGPHLVERIRPLLDRIFGDRNGRDDILWPTPQRHVLARERKAAHEYDLILQYSKSAAFVHHPQFKEPTQAALDTTRYHQSDEHGAYILLDLTLISSRPAFQFEWHGLFPPAGRSWRYSNVNLAPFSISVLPKTRSSV